MATTQTFRRSSEEAARLASVARRYDIFDQLVEGGVIEVTPLLREHYDLTVSLRPDTEQFEVERWRWVGRGLWLLRISRASWGGGDAEAWEDLVLTEYDLSDPRIRELVLAVVRSPGSATIYDQAWAASNTQPRLRTDGDLVEMRIALSRGIRDWVEAVDRLRIADSSAYPIPVMGGREL